MTITAAAGGVRRHALPPGWRWARLGDVCQINPRRPARLDRARDAPTTFVSMTAVDDRLGAITSPELRPYSEVAKGYTYFEQGDVLFAKITPCMQNGKHAIARDLIDGIGFGSTEFHVLRPGSNVTAEWVHFYVRQPSVLTYAETYLTGAVGQQRLPPSFLAALELPLPPVPEQQRIVARLTEMLGAVERARAAAAAQLEAAQQLAATFLKDVFDGAQARVWPVIRLADAAEIVSGITLGRKLDGKLARRIPYLRVANVKDGHLDLDDVYETEATEAEIEKLRLHYGDLLLTEGGDRDKLGRGTFWRDEIAECIHQNHIFRVRFDLTRFVPEFVSAQVGSAYGKRYFLVHGKQTTGIATINRHVLGNFPLLAPPLSEQRRIVALLAGRLALADTITTSVGAQLGAIDQLHAALVRQAFQGGV